MSLAGNSLFGVYLLSQICVVVTYWAVFALGRSIVGAQHAALAVLLMVGISSFTVPTPDFGPVMLTMALWAAILLHYWRAVSEGRRGYWVALVGRDRPPVPHHLCGAVAVRPARAVHGRQQARPRGDAIDRSVAREHRRHRRAVPASALAVGNRRRTDASG